MPLYLKRFFKGDRKDSKGREKDKEGGGKVSLRNYYIIAGTYLLVVVVAFSVVVLRWGPTPQLDLPGFEGTMELPTGEQERDSGSEKLAQNGDQPDEPDSDAVVLRSGEAGTSDTLDLSDETGDNIPVDEPGDDPGEEQEELTELPVAANPLPRFEVTLPFGNYISTSIPSGGAVHHLSRGVLLRTTPSAPVSALWDGVVTQVKVMDGHYRCSVLIEHTEHIGEYSSFYGNMREVWVKEGALVSRGENIGLMAYSVGREEQAAYEGSLPVSGRPTTGEGQSLTIRTVISGYIGEFPESGTELAPSFPEESVPALLPPETNLPLNHPLLYLEVREGGNFVDPLNFITARN